MTMNDPNPKEPDDSNLLDGEMDMYGEPEFVLDNARYWEEYYYLTQVHAVLDMADEILRAAAPSAGDEPK